MLLYYRLDYIKLSQNNYIHDDFNTGHMWEVLDIINYNTIYTIVYVYCNVNTNNHSYKSMVIDYVVRPIG